MYKPGQFISTPFGRMRVKKIKVMYPACNRCALKKDVLTCQRFAYMHHSTCSELIGDNGYLEKV